VKDPAAKSYWAPAPLLFIAGLCCFAYFILGFSMVFSYFSDPGSAGGVSGLVIGLVACAFSAVLTWSLINSRLVVASAGISVWRRMHRRLISWDSIKSFEIGAASSRSFLLAVVVVLDSEKFPIKATAGFSKRVDAIMKDLNGARLQYLQ
jgi:hypothetical protein